MRYYYSYVIPDISGLRLRYVSHSSTCDQSLHLLVLSMTVILHLEIDLFILKLEKSSLVVYSHTRVKINLLS